MTLEELKVNNIYELAHGIKYRLPNEFEGKSDKEIRSHLIYANTLILLKEDDTFYKDFLAYYELFFDFAKLDEVSEKDKTPFVLGDYLTLKVPKKDLDDYKIIAKAMNDFKKERRKFTFEKQTYEDFARVILSNMKLEDFINCYLADMVNINEHGSKINYRSACEFLTKYILYFRKQKIRIDLVKFISDYGKPTYCSVNVNGEEEETILNLFQTPDEIGLLINVFSNKHYVFVFKFKNKKINEIEVIGPAMTNYFNYKTLEIKFDFDMLSKNN